MRASPICACAGYAIERVRGLVVVAAPPYVFCRLAHYSAVWNASGWSHTLFQKPAALSARCLTVMVEEHHTILLAWISDNVSCGSLAARHLGRIILNWSCTEYSQAPARARVQQRISCNQPPDGAVVKLFVWHQFAGPGHRQTIVEPRRHFQLCQATCSNSAHTPGQPCCGSSRKS